MAAPVARDRRRGAAAGGDAARRPAAGGAGLRSPVVAAVGVAALLAGAGAAAAADWLPIFRTERIAAVSITESDLVDLPDLSAYGDVEVVDEPGVHQVADEAAAEAATGLTVPAVDELPRGVTGDRTFQVGDQLQVLFTFSAEKAARAAARAGDELPAPPAGLDGSQFRLTAGPGLASVWSASSGLPALVVARAVAPAGDSSGIPFATARDYLLSLPGMPDRVADQLRSFSDDGSTLPLPLPADQVTSSSRRRRRRARHGVPVEGRHDGRCGLGRGRRGDRGRRHVEHGRGAVGRARAAVTPLPEAAAQRLLAELPPSPAVWCSGLHKRYGRQVAVDGVSFTVARGEVMGLLGPNGAGKTSVIKMLLGLVRPDAGEVLLLGRPAREPQARARVGYLPELFRYQPWLTAAEVLTLHVRLAGVDVSADERRESLAAVGLAARAGDRVGGFSKGMQQRLGLAVALVARPELVVLDEPTSALDPIGRADVRDLLSRLKERGVAVLLNSHLIGEVERVCDRVVILDHGQVAASGSLLELLGGRELRLRLDGVGADAERRLAAAGRLTREGETFTVELAADDRGHRRTGAGGRPGRARRARARGRAHPHQPRGTAARHPRATTAVTRR